MNQEQQGERDVDVDEILSGGAVTSLRPPDRSVEPVWERLTQLGVDLTRAIGEAIRAGELRPAGLAVIYLRYVEERSMEAIGEALHMSPTGVCQLLKASLGAIRRTGLLDGYEEGRWSERRQGDGNKEEG